MALGNITIGDLGIKSISSTFDSLSSFIHVSTEAISTFTVSVAYWFILLVVIILALGMIYLFFWVYYKSLMAMLHIAPKIESAIEWVDYNLIERLKRMSENEPLPETEPAMDPDVAYINRRDDRD